MKKERNELLEALKSLLWVAESTHGAQQEVEKAKIAIAKAEAERGQL